MQGIAKARALAARGYAQAVLPPHERPDVAALRALGFSGTRRRRRRARGARGAAASGRLLVGCGDVGRQRGDGQPVGRHRRRARPSHAGQSRLALPSLARSRNDDARAARDLRRREAFRGPRAVARRAAVRRRRRGEFHAVRSSAGERGVELFVYGRSAFDAAAPAPQKYPGASDARSVGGDRAPPRDRFRAAASSRSSSPLRSTPASSTTTSSPSVTARALLPSARLGRAGRVLAELGAKLGPAFAPIVVPAERRVARRRRGDVSLQQPAPAARGRRAICSSRPRNAARTRALPRTSTRSSPAAGRSPRS